eukprot:TRINITY_DN12416_c0_g1_i1.p1 TRINITY_DN12416_c0_g1~~TRINITY_DN12416_c0_g1_i1.p1  ORF type:complete len:442 (-),score=54.95 TRINITY_DN12416_c0_g1_i1:137-1339(-)
MSTAAKEHSAAAACVAGNPAAVVEKRVEPIAGWSMFKRAAEASSCCMGRPQASKSSEPDDEHELTFLSARSEPETDIPLGTSPAGGDQSRPSGATPKSQLTSSNADGAGVVADSAKEEPKEDVVKNDNDDCIASPQKIKDGNLQPDDPDSPACIAADVRKHFQDLQSNAAAWISEADAQRLLVATEGDAQLARTKLKQAVSWKEGTFDAWLEADAEREMRLVAWGHGGRPMVYHCAVHQQKGDILAANWACCWHKSVQMASDPCSQIDIVLDCTGFQPWLNLTVTPYFKLAPSMDSFFAERIHRMIIIDFPRIAGFLWSGTKALLPPKTRQKVHFIHTSDAKSMEVLHELCVDDSMRSMLDGVMRMNRAATPSTGRSESHRRTERFLQSQQHSSHAKLDI